MTWGDGNYGGHSTDVQDQLKNVQQIQASSAAFAAILDDGTVVAWGDARSGGDSSSVRYQLKNVQAIQASRRAFAAILGNGSVVTWGDVGSGGDSSDIQDQLLNLDPSDGQAFASQRGLLAVSGSAVWSPMVKAVRVWAT